jgi:hypothetical protein
MRSTAAPRLNAAQGQATVARRDHFEEIAQAGISNQPQPEVDDESRRESEAIRFDRMQREMQQIERRLRGNRRKHPFVTPDDDRRERSGNEVTAGDGGVSRSVQPEERRPRRGHAAAFHEVERQPHDAGQEQRIGNQR